VALAYAIGLTVVLNRLFLQKPTGPPKPLPKSLFVPDAFTNPAHVRFALKVTLAAMFCYLLYTGLDWNGIHTAFVTCVFISLESICATLRKGVLRIAGCIIGGLLALFSIVYLIPQMVTIASLVVLVACVSAVAAWVATGTERIAYCGLQIAFAFYYGLFRSFGGYAPDTDLHNVRDRFVGILLGLVVTTLVFHYIWPEHAIDRLRHRFREVLRRLTKLLVIPSGDNLLQEAKPKAEALIAEISRELEQARREVELTSFEIDRAQPGRNSLGTLEAVLSQGERLLGLATLLTSDPALQEWRQLPPDAQEAEIQLRNNLAGRVECTANSDSAEKADADLSIALARWAEAVQRRSLERNRNTVVSQIAAEAQDLARRTESVLFIHNAMTERASAQ
jgi:multidrug resistance protein MdtO